MSTTHNDSKLALDQIPASILTFLQKSGSAEASGSFSPTATVSDVGTGRSSPGRPPDPNITVPARFEYTTTIKSASRLPDGRWVVLNQLQGNFPAGVAHLRYTFTLDGPLITHLEISA